MATRAAILAMVLSLCISAADAALIRNGGAVLLRGAGAPIALPSAWASVNGEAVAIGTVEAGHFRPARVLRG